MMCADHDDKLPVFDTLSDVVFEGDELLDALMSSEEAELIAHISF
jgi:hypothetical protein